MNPILSRNPRTGELIREIPMTSIDELPRIFERAKRAQVIWAKTPTKQRVRKFKLLQDLIVQRKDDLCRLIALETGKPEFEALTAEIIPALDLLSYYTKLAPGALKDREIKIQNPFMRYRKSTLQYWPVGTVAVIAPWNYPFYLAFGDIATALIAGNAVIFKPSEHTSSVGQKIQELFDEAAFPLDVMQTVYGHGAMGSAIIDQRPNKIFFTGSAQTGRKIMRQAADHLIPVSLELGGKDAMIVLPDADLDYATSAAIWGGFMNSGQVCASTERLLVAERIAPEFLQKLTEKMSQLSMQENLGVCTVEFQKEIYRAQLADARDRGLKILVGGEMSADGTRLIPTLVMGDGIENAKIYHEESFGPVMAVATFKTVQEAIQKANQSQYGLMASVITTNATLGEEVARELQVGSVLINEVAFSAALPETPWGGVKDSGMGRKHGEHGLMECVNVRHVNQPRFNFLRFKAWWWYPYSPFQREFFAAWAELYRGGCIEKLAGVPHMLWCLLKFLKDEKRL